MLPYTYRGYRYTQAELDAFRAFKRAGIIPRQAHPERYAITLTDWTMRYPLETMPQEPRTVELWVRTRTTPGCPPNVYERLYATMPLT